MAAVKSSTWPYVLGTLTRDVINIPEMNGLAYYYSTMLLLYMNIADTGMFMTSIVQELWFCKSSLAALWFLILAQCKAFFLFGQCYVTNDC